MLGRFAFLPSIALAAMSSASLALASWPLQGAAAAPSGVRQANPVVLSDRAGGAYVILEQQGQGIVAQRLAANGARALGWPAAGVVLGASVMPWQQMASPHLVSGPAGDAYAAYAGLYSGSVVTLSRIPGDGASRWPVPAVLQSSSPLETGLAESRDPGPIVAKGPGNFFPTLAADGEGGVLVAYDYVSLAWNRTVVQRVGPNGTPRWNADGLKILEGAWGAVVGSDGAGGAYVASCVYANGGDIVLQHVLASGAIDARWPAGGLSVCTNAARQESPTVVADGSGGAIVFWQDGREPGRAQIFANRFRADGTLAPGWRDEGIPICAMPSAPGIDRPGAFAGSRQYFSAIEDGTGGAFLCWTDRRGADADVYALRVGGAGAPAAGWFENGTPVCRASGDQDRPTLASDGAGGVYVTWQDARSGDLDVYAQRLTASGTRPRGWIEDGVAICAVAGAQRTPVIAASGERSAIVAWTDERGSLPQIYARHVDGDALVPVLAKRVRPEPATAFAFEGLSPSPGRTGALRLALSASRAGIARLEVFDVTGRRAHVRDLAVDAGRAPLPVGLPGLAPGIWMLRVTMDGVAITRRACILD